MKSLDFRYLESGLADEVHIQVHTAVHMMCTGGHPHAPKSQPAAASRDPPLRPLLAPAPAAPARARGECTPSARTFLCFSLRTHVPSDGDAEAQRLCLRGHHATSELFAPFRPHGHLQAAPAPIAATVPPTME
jgi:hypothetical protein